MRSTRLARTLAGLLALSLGLAFSSSCRRQVRTVPPSSSGPGAVPGAPSRPASTEELARMGYTIQVGAFAVLDNARALAKTLAAEGVDAFYFPSGTGLFKVRFGNFASRDAALEEAKKLKAGGRIGDYFIVGPADYAVTRPSLSKPSPDAAPPPVSMLRDRLVETAKSFIGVDYAWGGTSTRSGFDCSGLVQAVYQLNGLAMPRSVREQSQAGVAVTGERLKKGDLVFFSETRRGPLTHVGVYIGEGVFIHAPGSGKNVRRESLTGWFRTHYSGGRAYLGSRWP